MHHNIRLVKGDQGKVYDVPEHLTGMNGLVVELDSNRVYGALLAGLANSGQAFSFRTLTNEEPIAHDDRMTSERLCFVVEGPGYVTEAIDSPLRPGVEAWRLDELVRYRIIKHSDTDPMFWVTLAEDPFWAYDPDLTSLDKDEDSRGDEEDIETEEQDQQRELVANAVAMFGGFLTDIGVLLVRRDGQIDPVDVMDIGFETIGATEEERNEILTTFIEAKDASERAAQMIIGVAARALKGEGR